MAKMGTLDDGSVSPKLIPLWPILAGIGAIGILLAAVKEGLFIIVANIQNIPVRCRTELVHKPCNHLVYITGFSPQNQTSTFFDGAQIYARRRSQSFSYK